MYLYVLFFCQYWACWYKVFYWSSNVWHNLHLLSASVCNIFIACYFVCKAKSFAAITLLWDSAFRSPVHSQRNVFYSLKGCLSILLFYWPCITTAFPFSLTHSPNLAFVRFMPYFLLSLFRPQISSTSRRKPEIKVTVFISLG
jgi:hypothetical protein